MPLPVELRTLINSPRYLVREATSREPAVYSTLSGFPRPPPRAPILADLFERISTRAAAHDIAWSEWACVSTAALFALNSPGTLKAMHNYLVTDEAQKRRSLNERMERACLLREAGLRCVGLIGTPKLLTQSINNLAALRAMVDADEELAAAMPNEPRRDLNGAQWERSTVAGDDVFDNIYQKVATRVRDVMNHSHPDLGRYVLKFQYGPLFAPPPMYTGGSEPAWEVNRLRMSLVAISVLHAQGGVGPQVTSHVYGLLRARPFALERGGRGLDFLTTNEGAVWVLETINELCRVVDGTPDAEREVPSKL